MASKSTSLYGWCFWLAGMSSASGASLPFYFGGAGHFLFHCQQLRLRYGRVVFSARHAGLSAVNHAQKRALCLGRRYEKMLLTHSFLFRCVSQPPPLRGTSFHRKEGEPCSCIAFPYCHFERKREIFFCLRSIRNGRASENGKHGTPYATSCTPGSRRFIWALKIP